MALIRTTALLCLMQFTAIQSSDRALIESYTFPNHNICNELSFVNLYTWAKFYDTAYAELHDFLYVRMCLHHKLCYWRPLRKGCYNPLICLNTQEIQTYVQDIEADAAGKEYGLVGLTPENVEVLRNTFPGEFAYACNRNLSDYLYTSEQLATLSGKKNQSKRNFINRFKTNYPNYRIEPLEPKHFEACLNLVKHWGESRHQTTEYAELHAIKQAFQHWNQLGTKGLTLWVGEDLAAFSYGSGINHHTWCTHIEKADTRFEGAYTMINNSMALMLRNEYTYINREEDMGVAGMRKAKTSYHPLMMVCKFTAKKLNTEERAYKALWQTVFGDDDAFVDQFLLQYFQPELSYHTQDHAPAGDATVGNAATPLYTSMLHVIPFHSEQGKAAYIYACATHPAYRKQGLFKNLLHQALTDLRAQGYDYALLIPATEDLFAFYEHLGFQKQRYPIEFSPADSFDFGNDTGENIGLVYPLTETFEDSLETPQATTSSEASTVSSETTPSTPQPTTLRLEILPNLYSW